MTRPQTLGELKAGSYQPCSIKDEIRRNLMSALRRGDELFPGIIGYEKTVIPQLVNALLSRHDILLLGLRGQAKTRVIRLLTRLLDEYIPIVAGSEINDEPLRPISCFARELVAEHGDDTPIAWVHREDRYREKLATPDVTVADLLGDIDPVKAATLRLSFASEHVIHYGIIPRTNRGIFAINELPDLQPRIQVGLLNIMQEKDLQIRGFPIRLPLDLLMVFTANPEDYTNRGNIISPLKDRIDSQIMTHYPHEIEAAKKITRQEAWDERASQDGHAVDVPIFDYLRVIIEEVAFEARKSDYIDQNSGVSARLPICLLENVVSNAERRALCTGGKRAVPRICDLLQALTAVTGKIELVYEGEQQGVLTVARHVCGRAIKVVFDQHFPDAYTSDTEEASFGPYKDVIAFFAAGQTIEVSDTMSDREYGQALRAVTSLEQIANKYMPGHAKNPDELLPVMELVLEGLHQSRVLAKDELETGGVFRDMLGSMLDGLETGPRRQRRGKEE